MELTKKFSFSISELENNDEKLDLFVRLAAKCVIELFALNGSSTDDYDEYIKNVESDLQLRQQIAQVCLNKNIRGCYLEPEIFEELFVKYPTMIYNKILEPIGIKMPQKQLNEHTKKFEIREQEEISEKTKKVTTIYYELYNGQTDASSAPSDLTSNTTVDSADQDSNNNAPVVPEQISSAPESNFKLEEIIETKIDKDGNELRLNYSLVEQKIAMKILDILKNSDLSDEDLSKYCIDKYTYKDINDNGTLVKHCNARS